MTHTCHKCSAIKTIAGESTRIPSGWHRLSDQMVCGECWGKSYMLRAITFPVAEPLSGSWQELRAALADMWSLTTQASNWMVTEMYARDVRRSGEKLAPMPKIYLYPEARALFPGLPSQSVAALEQAIRGKYRAKRMDVIWRCAAALPTFRYPTPFAIPNQGWSAWFDEGNRPVVSARIADKRWEVRLRGGDRFRRQLVGLRQIVSGGAVQGEIAFYRAHDGEIMCKLVAWLPKPEQPRPQEGTLSVRSTQESLLVAVDPERIWTYNADHVRRWSAEHARLIQRLAEDQKAEQRPDPSFADRRTAATGKYRRRMQSATHEISRSLAEFARRRKFVAVRYDDSNHGFCEQFPWFELRAKVESKLAEYGIRFEIASGQAVGKTESPLAEGESK